MTLSASIGAFGFARNLTIPLVTLRRLQLDFTGYPNVRANEAVSVERLGLVQCLPGTYHHATARVRAYLSDDAALGYVVTGSCAFESDADAVVRPAGSRMEALAPGAPLITARFGGRSSDSVVLPVSDEVLNPASAVTLQVSLQGGRTLLMTQGGERRSVASG